MPAEMFRRFRLANLRALFRYRWGSKFPEDDAGRIDLEELLLPLSLGLDPCRRMGFQIDEWAPWMLADERESMIEKIMSLPLRARMVTNRALGERQQVTNDVRELLGLWTIWPCDMTKGQLAEQRKAKARERAKRRRAARGGQSREQYLAALAGKEKPWVGLGMRKATFYRWRKIVEAGCTRSLLHVKEPIEGFPQTINVTWVGRGVKGDMVRAIGGHARLVEVPLGHVPRCAHEPSLTRSRAP